MAELIRSYVQASTQLPRSQWRRNLTHLEMLIWDDMIHWPTYSGVFRYDIEWAAYYYRADPSDVDNALEKFVKDDKIERENDFVYVINFISFQQYSPPSVKSTRNELEKLESSAGAGLVAKAMQSLCNAYPNVLQGRSKGVAKDIRDETRLNETKRDNTTRDTAAGRLDALVDTLPKPVQREWLDFADMIASQRKNGKVSDAVLLKHLERIVANRDKVSDEALCFGLQQAVIAEADNHTYVLKAAKNYKGNGLTYRAKDPEPIPDDVWMQAQARDEAGRAAKPQPTAEDVAAMKRMLGASLKSPEA